MDHTNKKYKTIIHLGTLVHLQFKTKSIPMSLHWHIVTHAYYTYILHMHVTLAYYYTCILLHMHIITLAYYYTRILHTHITHAIMHVTHAYYTCILHKHITQTPIWCSFMLVHVSISHVICTRAIAVRNCQVTYIIMSATQRMASHLWDAWFRRELPKCHAEVGLRRVTLINWWHVISAGIAK